MRVIDGGVAEWAAHPSRSRSGDVEGHNVDLSDTAEAAEFRAEVRSFLAEVLPDDWRGVGALSL